MNSGVETKNMRLLAHNDLGNGGEGLSLQVTRTGQRICFGLQAHSFSSLSVNTISTVCGTVSWRFQSRCSSHASETQPIGTPPA